MYVQAPRNPMLGPSRDEGCGIAVGDQGWAKRMSIRAARIWENVQSSYWFLPSLMVLGAVVSSFLLIELDRKVQAGGARRFWFVYAGGPEGARAVLEAIAGSMIAVASIVFSITIVSLTLAAQQLGPRILRNFMRDKATQIGLGVFISAFLHAVLILRQVRGPGEDAVAPHLSVTVALILVILSLIVLIYFVHHTASVIQAGNVPAAITRDLLHTIEHVFPEEIGAGAEEREETRGAPDVPAGFDSEARILFGRSEGYVVAIENRPLLETARQSDLVVKLECRPGSYVDRWTPIARAWPPQNVTREVAEKVAKAIKTGAQPSMEEDAQFVFTQLVVIAVRALSPSVNDPFTATTCIDRLGTALSKLATRSTPSPYRYDRDGRLRVIASPVTFSEIASPVFEDIRHYGRSSPAVMNTLLDMIARVGPLVRGDEDKDTLLFFARRIWTESRQQS